jgi:aryl-alcohol dehydrogenase-like predicted oxidoreductase
MVTAPYRIPRRSIPGTTLESSLLGITLTPGEMASPASDDRAVALLAAARSRGVTTIELPDGPGARHGERLVARAFAPEGPECTLLLGRSLTSLAGEGARSDAAILATDLESRLRRSIEASAERVSPQRVGILEWSHDSESDVPLADAIDALRRLRAGGTIAGWALHLPPGAALPPRAGSASDGGAELFCGGLSALDPRLARAMSERADVGPLGFFARDPFGAGRLDGSRFAASVADRRPDARPANVRELRREFDPVLRLAFLTERTGRTLAQAALQFVYRWPWVCSALVPLPAPERLEELARSGSVPPLSDAEVERILSAAGGTRE